jgi:hypothetical protein
MDTVVVKGGKFTFTFSAKELSRGLRPTKEIARNMEFLQECKGAVGFQGALSVLDSMSRIDTSVITDSFPFPQIFVFSYITIVCGLKKIYEWDGSNLSLKYTATTPGSTWSAVDFFDYLYLSNGKEAVIRSASSKVYALSTTQPKAMAMCNYNGQVMIGAPDVGTGISELIVASPFIITTSITGAHS